MNFYTFNNLVNLLSQELDNQKIVIAVSTGVDSMVLLDLCLKANLDIIVAHVNHNIRLESIKEAEFLKKYCDKHQIKYYQKDLFFDTKSNFQENARYKRYQFFEEVIKQENAHYLLTAHHGDDNLETILMRLIKGSSLSGYLGIEAKSQYHQYLIYRPLLNFSKDQILTYANINNIHYFEDLSNHQLTYTRNRIRQLVIPSLRQENPSILTAINHFIKTINLAKKLVDQEIKKYVTDDGIVKTIELVPFNNLDSDLKEQILFDVLKKYKLSTIQINDLLKQIASPKPKIINLINQRVLMIKEYQQVSFIDQLNLPQPFKLKIDTIGEYDLGNNQSIKVSFIDNKNICYFKTINQEMWYNIVDLPIFVRSKEPGDQLVINGHTKSVSNYLTDHKYSYLEREKLLLLCNKNNMPMYILGKKPFNKNKGDKKNE